MLRTCLRARPWQTCTHSLFCNQRMMSPPRSGVAIWIFLENTFYDSTVQSLFHMFSTKGAITTKEHSYQKDVHNAVLHHNLIIVENLSPVLSPQEREKQKQEITKSLYEVFKKYSDNHKSNRSWLRGLPFMILSVSSPFPYRNRKGCWKYVCHLHKTICF